MKLYVGSRNYKPEGYLTVDIDPQMKPDIVADITRMDNLDSDSVDEIIAGHVLEHIDWPDSFLAFAEFARVLKTGGTLKIAIPDMGSLVRMMLSGDSAFHVIGLIYGVGGRTNRFEQHRYGFTAGMLVDILETLGFSRMNWWNSAIADASNGWVPRYENEHVGMSLNIEAIKERPPAVEPKALYDALVQHPLSDFLTVAASVRQDLPIQDQDTGQVPKLYQRIHFQLIDARQRIKYLEQALLEQQSRNADPAQTHPDKPAPFLKRILRGN